MKPHYEATFWRAFADDDSGARYLLGTIIKRKGTYVAREDVPEGTTEEEKKHAEIGEFSTRAGAWSALRKGLRKS